MRYLNNLIYRRMEQLFYTRQQLRVFADDLHKAFLRSGFEVLEEPYIDNALCGFRAIYTRRYLLQKSSSFYDGIYNSIVHVVGLPFGRQSQKMVVLAAPRNIYNEPISETMKLRINFDEYGGPHAISGENQSTSTNHDHTVANNNNPFKETELTDVTSPDQRLYSASVNKFFNSLMSYVSDIIVTVSPGLIQLPVEMKLEILKKLNLDSIIRMSQVNSEFRSLIFQHGEPLWRHLCRRDFNIRSINRGVHRSWIELYRDSYITEQVQICRKERALPGLPERPALPPAPYRLQIEWLPEVLELPLYPINHLNGHNNVIIPFEAQPLRRVDSLDSIS